MGEEDRGTRESAGVSSLMIRTQLRASGGIRDANGRARNAGTTKRERIVCRVIQFVGHGPTYQERRDFLKLGRPWVPSFHYVKRILSQEVQSGDLCREESAWTPPVFPWCVFRIGDWEEQHTHGTSALTRRGWI